MNERMQTVAASFSFTWRPSNITPAARQPTPQPSSGRPVMEQQSSPGIKDAARAVSDATPEPDGCGADSADECGSDASAVMSDYNDDEEPETKRRAPAYGHYGAS
eukprot:6112282-Pleurochrysis_carterae.AAC.1